MSGRHIGNCIEKTKKREDNKWKSWAKFGDACRKRYLSLTVDFLRRKQNYR